MGGFDAHAGEERQINQEAMSSGEAQSELLLTLPGAQLHQVFENDERLFPLAEGTLTVVSVSLPRHENRIGLVAKVGEFEYPLANDTACLRSAPFQYVFALSDGVLVGLTLAEDTPREGIDLFELLLEQCCDFSVQEDGLSKPTEVRVTKPGRGEQQEVTVDSTRRPQLNERADVINQQGSGITQNGTQGRNKYVLSGPDAPSPSQAPPGVASTSTYDSRLPAYDSVVPSSQPTGGNRYVVSGPGLPAAPPGMGQGIAPGTSAYGAGAGAYGGAAYDTQVPVVQPDGTVIGGQRPKKVGERLAVIVGSGAAMLGQGIVKGGEWTAAKIQEHGQKQKAKMVPNERPAEIPVGIRSAAWGANQATRNVDKTSKKVVGGAVYVITAAASSAAAAVRAVGGNHPTPGKEPVIGARAFAVASVDGIAHVLDALELSGKRVMATSREVGSDLMQHKYGAQAAQLTSDSMSTLGHMIHAGWTIRKLGFRTVARSAATNTALHVFRSNRADVSSNAGNQAISGWNTAPSANEMEEARRVNQATVATGLI